MSSSVPSTAEGDLRRARAELESDLRADKKCRAEELLVAYPAVAADTDAALELVYTEYVVRDQMGQKPTPDEWYERFPQYRADLEQMFEVHNELVKAEDNSFSRTLTAGRPRSLLGRMPERIAGYEIIGEVGRGGMGVVYKARQVNLNRVVALKVILSGAYAGEHERSRFRREVEAAARLDHPHIVGVYEVGEQDGRPFCAMEFVGGGTLADRLTGTPWTAPSAAGLLAIVARAAHHAHERGIVHRDLKPANILIAQTTKTLSLQLGSSDKGHTQTEDVKVDDLANPKVADFGLAKCLTDSDPGPTRMGNVVGTPAYMAPEQASGKAGLIGPATDVWVVGVILYELLTGRPPFRGESAVETLIQIRNEDPVSPRQLRPQLPRDLDTICLKCLQKDPAKRYLSAAELADDLDRWLRGEPVHARPLAWPGRFARWCRRNPRVATLSGAVAFLLVVAAALGGAVSLNLAAARDRAEAVANQERDARQLADDALNREEAARKLIEAARLQEAAARKIEQEHLLREQARVVHLHVADGVQRLDEGDNAGAAVSFAVALEKEPDPAAREIHRIRLAAVLQSTPRLERISNIPTRYTPSEFSLLDGDVLNELGPDGHYVIDHAPVLFQAVTAPDGKPMSVLALSHDGRTAIATGPDHRARAWEISTGVPLTLPRPAGSSPFPPPFSPDGRWFINSPRTPATRELRIHDTATGKQVGLSQPLDESISDIRFTPDGKRLLVIAGNATLWDPTTGEPIGEPMRQPQRINLAAVSPDSRWIVTAGSGARLQIWDAATAKAVGTMLPIAGDVLTIAFSRDSKQFATATTDRTVRFWNVESGRLTAVLLAQMDTIMTLAFRPDGKQLATGCENGTVRLWDTASGRPASPTLFSHGPIWRILFSPDGRGVTALSSGRRLHTWQLEGTSLHTATLGKRSNNYHLAWNPDGNTILTAGLGGAKLWDPTGKPGFVFRHPGEHVWRAEFNKDGSRVVTCGEDAAQVWDTKTGKNVCPPLRSGLAADAAFSPDGRRVATIGQDGLIQLWNTESGEHTGITIPSWKGRSFISFNHDGTRLLTLGNSKIIKVYNANNGTAVSEFNHDALVLDAAFSPAGGLAATTTMEGEISLWDVETGKRVGAAFGHRYKMLLLHTTRRLEFSPDGSKLLAAEWNRSAQVWDVKTGRPISLPMGHPGEVTRATFNSDARLVATAGWDGTVRVWDAASGQPVTLPLEHDGPVRLVAFSPDSRRLVTSTEMGPARVWDLTPDARTAEEVGAYTRLLANRRLDDRGVLVPLTEDEETQLWQRFKPRVK